MWNNSTVWQCLLLLLNSVDSNADSSVKSGVIDYDVSSGVYYTSKSVN